MSFEYQPHCSLSEEVKVLRGDSEIRNCIEHNALDKGVEGNTASLNGNLGSGKETQTISEFPKRPCMERGQFFGFHKILPSTITCKIFPREED